MSYDCTLLRCDFRIAPDKIEGAKQALWRSGLDAPLSNLSQANIRNLRLGWMMGRFDWPPRHEDEVNGFLGFDRDGDWIGDWAEELWATLAPFVDEGGFIECSGSDEGGPGRWQWRFYGGEVHRVSPELKWPPAVAEGRDERLEAFDTAVDAILGNLLGATTLLDAAATLMEDICRSDRQGPLLELQAHSERLKAIRKGYAESRLIGTQDGWSELHGLVSAGRNLITKDLDRNMGEDVITEADIRRLSGALRAYDNLIET